MTGREDASALLDYPEASGIMSRYDDETGSEIAPYSSADHHKLGYDPSEVAAGMVLLHNQNRDGLSNGYLDEDKDRLVDIFNKRQQMQRNYEQRTSSPWRTASGEGPKSWYHASPHDLPEGTVLIPGGGESPWGGSMGDETLHDHVWISPDESDAHYWKDAIREETGKGHVYEVEPENARLYQEHDPDGYHVSDRAVIKRRLASNTAGGGCHH